VPNISNVMKLMYPFLTDHPIVESYPKIKGIEDQKNYLFFNHNYKE